MHNGFHLQRGLYGRPLCVLIVDDEEADRLLGASSLAEAGYVLLFASSGEAALKIYQEYHVDVVVTDLAMPNGNGHLLIRRILEADRGARIIAVSGRSADQLEWAQKYGAVRTLTKPITPFELVSAVHEAATEEGATKVFDDGWWG